MDISYRPYNSEEIKRLKSQKFSAWKQIENFGMKWVCVSILLLFPFLLYESFIAEVPPNIELSIIVVIEITSIAIVVYWMYKWGELSHNKQIEKDIRLGEAEITKIKTDFVLKRKETEDFGSGFYLKIESNKTLYLQGQYFDELQYAKKFPNTEFEIVRSRKNKELLDIISKGEYLKPVRKLKPFTKEQFKSGLVHEDGQILNIPVDEIN